MRRFCMTSILAIAIPLVGAAAQPSPHAYEVRSSGPIACSTARRCTRDGAFALSAIESTRSGRARASRLRTTTIDLPGTTLLPGLIEGHSHLLLHPYNETVWDDQVLQEPLGLRAAGRSTISRRRSMAGFTTIRDLGTEGAGYADVGLKQAIEQGDRPRPAHAGGDARDRRDRQLRPEGFALEWRRRRRARRRPTARRSMRVVRDQIGRGADWIKVYADYRWGAAGEAAPTFTLDELQADRRAARSSGRPVVGARHHGRGDAARGRWPASRRSSTATAARRRSFALMAEQASRSARRSPPVTRSRSTAAGEGRGSRAGRRSREARELQGRARGRRHDPQRQRRRRLRARHQRARARADGRLRHGAARRAEERDRGAAQDPPHRRHGRTRRRRGSLPT